MHDDMCTEATHDRDRAAMLTAKPVNLRLFAGIIVTGAAALIAAILLAR